MSIEIIAANIGYAVMVLGASVLLTGAIAIVASLINEWAKDAHRAAMNTYWWARWIRWHRIARARKEAKK